MAKFLSAIAFVLLGFILGWTLKPNSELETHSQKTDSTFAIPSSNSTSNEEDLTEYVKSFREAPQVEKKLDNLTEVNNKKQASALDKFMQLLSAKRYTEAVNYYQDVERNDASLAPVLKRALLKDLKQKLSSSEFQAFSDIAEYWLSSYYNDIDVLLKLAEYNARQNFFGEAVSLYQLIYSYARNNSDYEKIDLAFSRFVRSRDARLLEEQAWYELQAFYESLDQADIAGGANLFRLAEIYLHNGYVEDARYIIDKLITSKRFEIQARNLLSDIESGEYKKHVFREIDYKTVPLQRFGEHFIATITIQDSAPLNLLLDTGASITSISESAFNEKLNNIRYMRWDTRLFNTANGVTRGRVLKVASVFFGGQEFKELEIAIMPGSMSEHVDGLLGMNILRQFRFHLDQENAELILEPK